MNLKTLKIFVMNKAIVVTRFLYELPNEEQELINNTNIFKIAVNHVLVKNAEYRIFHDHQHFIWYCGEWWKKDGKFNGNKLITNQLAKPLLTKLGYHHSINMFYKTVSKPNTPNKDELFMWNGTLIPAIDLCIKKNFEEILLIANNQVYHDGFRTEINKAIERLKEFANIYQCSKGNFNLNIKNIKEFI